MDRIIIEFTKLDKQVLEKKTKYYCELCDLVFFCSAYKQKHEEGKRHINLELCMKFQNELNLRELNEKIIIL